MNLVIMTLTAWSVSFGVAFGQSLGSPSQPGGHVHVQKPPTHAKGDHRHKRMKPHNRLFYYRDDWRYARRQPRQVVREKLPGNVPKVRPNKLIDPLGPRFETARGIATSDPGIRVGAPLPPRLPILALDWQRYRLPEPEAGTMYARAANQIILLSKIDNRVVEVFDVRRQE